MKKLNNVLNALLIIFLSYAFFVLGQLSTALVITILVSSIVVTNSHQKKTIAWFAYIGNIILALFGLVLGVVFLVGAAPVEDGIYMGLLLLLLLGFPCVLNIFFIKIRYFPSRVRLPH
ncbi:hypothetical protein L3I74_004454 [Vibrio parahaemolyticus]|uniref:hypothetical protein n=1 Tax=Vibrio parahaemolyticus TaxID=670 RepID=UPI001DD412A1|nr:hypothetical protein [Vibrio parahaemolyticus]EHR1165371.1 hypothetical protein [Vibrio parahaemolyticus]EIU6832451.1 hypothetical protein [Vibrio parahaemolyticus]EIU7852577.1 hypothetical protein [Vibrio parahaemolyticus]ELA9435265.1 hypothetical protein [Vibrio parahaemolyticus]